MRSVIIAALVASVAAIAQERPSEDSMFGEPPAQPAGVGDEQTGPKSREEEALSGPAAQSAFDTGAESSDPLKIGGQFYLRAQLQTASDRHFDDSALSLPTLIDAYMDARPNDRVRAMVVGRLSFDPSLSSDSSTDTTGSSTGVGGSLFGASTRSNPSVLLDQAWVRFDIERQVFVTAGKQHVKWGAARFWNPTDFLSPTRRDPLLQFDPRVGATMVKFHVPWEQRGWNFYALALFDNAGPANVLGEIGGAARAELVFGETEVGIDGVLQRGKRPRVGFDVSSALGPLDVYGELSLRTGTDNDLPRIGVETVEATQVQPGEVVYPFDDQLYRVSFFQPEGIRPAATVGATWTLAYSENDNVTFGAEYFYNSNGYGELASGGEVPTFVYYPLLIQQGAFNPFYSGSHYAALYAVLFGPGSWDKTSFVFSTLGNLADFSFVSRLDFNVRVLSYLTVEAFTAVHYGKRGVFRFALDVDPAQFGVPGERIRIPPPLVDLGIGLRVNI